MSRNADGGTNVPLGPAAKKTRASARTLRRHEESSLSPEYDDDPGNSALDALIRREQLREDRTLRGLSNKFRNEMHEILVTLAKDGSMTLSYSEKIYKRIYEIVAKFDAEGRSIVDRDLKRAIFLMLLEKFSLPDEHTDVDEATRFRLCVERFSRVIAKAIWKLYEKDQDFITSICSFVNDLGAAKSSFVRKNACYFFKYIVYERGCKQRSFADFPKLDDIYNALYAFCSDPNAAVRRAAAQAFGLIQDWAIPPNSAPFELSPLDILYDMCNDRHKEVRLNVIHLINVTDENIRGVRIIMDIACNRGEHIEVRKMAIKSLCKISPSAVGAENVGRLMQQTLGSISDLNSGDLDSLTVGFVKRYISGKADYVKRHQPKKDKENLAESTVEERSGQLGMRKSGLIAATIMLLYRLRWLTDMTVVKLAYELLDVVHSLLNKEQNADLTLPEFLEEIHFESVEPKWVLLESYRSIARSDISTVNQAFKAWLWYVLTTYIIRRTDFPKSDARWVAAQGIRSEALKFVLPSLKDVVDVSQQVIRQINAMDSFGTKEEVHDTGVEMMEFEAKQRTLAYLNLVASCTDHDTIGVQAWSKQLKLLLRSPKTRLNPSFAASVMNHLSLLQTMEFEELISLIEEVCELPMPVRRGFWEEDEEEEEVVDQENENQELASSCMDQPFNGDENALLDEHGLPIDIDLISNTSEFDYEKFFFGDDLEDVVDAVEEMEDPPQAPPAAPVEEHLNVSSGAPDIQCGWSGAEGKDCKGQMDVDDNGHATETDAQSNGVAGSSESSEYDANEETYNPEQLRKDLYVYLVYALMLVSTGSPRSTLIRQLFSDKIPAGMEGPPHTREVCVQLADLLIDLSPDDRSKWSLLRFGAHIFEDGLKKDYLTKAAALRSLIRASLAHGPERVSSLIDWKVGYINEGDDDDFDVMEQEFSQSMIDYLVFCIQDQRAPLPYFQSVAQTALICLSKPSLNKGEARSKIIVAIMKRMSKHTLSDSHFWYCVFALQGYARMFRVNREVIIDAFFAYARSLTPEEIKNPIEINLGNVVCKILDSSNICQHLDNSKTTINCSQLPSIALFADRAVKEMRLKPTGVGNYMIIRSLESINMEGFSPALLHFLLENITELIKTREVFDSTAWGDDDDLERAFVAEQLLKKFQEALKDQIDEIAEELVQVDEEEVNQSIIPPTPLRRRPLRKRCGSVPPVPVAWEEEQVEFSNSPIASKVQLHRRGAGSECEDNCDRFGLSLRI